jgi:hypothetical protein
MSILVGLICFASFLRSKGFLKEEDGKLFSRLVTSITLPALIFHTLSHTQLEWKWGILAVIMLCSEIFCLFLAWIAGKIMKLDNPQLGAVMLTAGFGSSSLLGYALINEVFPGNTLALGEATVISEMGVGPSLFTIGVMVAMYFGSKDEESGSRFKTALLFFKSPIFFSVVGGVIWSTFGLPTDAPIISTIFRGINILASANSFCVALTVGLLLHFQGLRSVAAVAGVVGILKLVLKPVIIWLPSLGLGLDPMQIQVLVLEAAMPSAMLSVVLASQYGCDERMASKLVFATSAASMITIIVMFRLLT